MIRLICWCIRWFGLCFPNYSSRWHFTGDMNTFQLSNIGVTTWFHAGADNATTNVNVVNTPSTSTSTVMQNTAKGFKCHILSSSTFPCLFLLHYGFLIYSAHKICLYFSGYLFNSDRFSLNWSSTYANGNSYFQIHITISVYLPTFDTLN